MTEVENGSGAQSQEDDILKEIEEIDWTEEDAVGAEGTPFEDESLDDFDVGELECVDEEGEERKVEDEKSHVKPSSSSKEPRKSNERHHPYKRVSNGRDTSDSPRRHRDSTSRTNRSQRRKKEWLAKKKKEKAEQRKMEQIDTDDLEEVDCCDENDDVSDAASSFSSATPSSDFQRLDDGLDDDPWAKRISQADTSVFNLDDDDDEFPSISEEMDTDVLRKAAEERPREEETKGAVHEPAVDSTTKSPREKTPERRRSPRPKEEERRRRPEAPRESRRSQYEDDRRRKRRSEPEDDHRVNSTTNGGRQRHHEATSSRVESYATGLRKETTKEVTVVRKTSEEKRRHHEERKQETDVPPPTSSQIRNLLKQLDAREEEIKRRRGEHRKQTTTRDLFPPDRREVRVRQPTRRSYL